jgi:hypothetical protein
MKRLVSTFVGALLATTAIPAFAATALAVPVGSSTVAQISWDATNSRSSDEPATVHVSNDGKDLILNFDVPQRETIIGSAAGDSVAVDIWPGGSSSDLYRLGVNLDGTRTSDSTPNTSNWEASAQTHPGSYNVTVKIPLDSVSGLGGGDTRIQFSRWISSTADEQTWSHSSGAGDDDVAQAGSLSLGSSAAATTP